MICLTVAVPACSPREEARESTGGFVEHRQEWVTQQSEFPTLELPSLEAAVPAEYPGLHQVVAYGPGLFSGSAPECDEAFESLEALGFRTIISVDGAAPEVSIAASHGMRYVHLPIGYNGMDRERTLEIARAIKELPGPVYLHCHHGKHRSAGAAGAAAVTLGLLTNDDALARMQVSGTAPNYTGLFQCVDVATIATQAELQSVRGDFPSRWRTTGMVQTMVEIDQAFEHLKLIERSQWRSPEQHPDLVPAAEAGMLADLLGNLDEDENTKRRGAEFAQWLAESSAAASSLETAILEGRSLEQLSSLLTAVSHSCKDCHAKYRDR